MAPNHDPRLRKACKVIAMTPRLPPRRARNAGAMPIRQQDHGVADPSVATRGGPPRATTRSLQDQQQWVRQSGIVLLRTAAAGSVLTFARFALAA